MLLPFTDLSKFQIDLFRCDAKSLPMISAAIAGATVCNVPGQDSSTFFHGCQPALDLGMILNSLGNHCDQDGSTYTGMIKDGKRHGGPLSMQLLQLLGLRRDEQKMVSCQGHGVWQSKNCQYEGQWKVGLGGLGGLGGMHGERMLMANDFRIGKSLRIKYTHTYIYIYTYICVYTYIYIYVCAYMCIYIYTHTYVYIYICIHIHIHIHIDIYIYIYINTYMSLSLYLSIYIYIYTVCNVYIYKI